VKKGWFKGDGNAGGNVVQKAINAGKADGGRKLMLSHSGVGNSVPNRNKKSHFLGKGKKKLNI